MGVHPPSGRVVSGDLIQTSTEPLSIITDQLPPIR